MAVAKNKRFLKLFTETLNSWNCSFLVLQNYIVGTCYDGVQGDLHMCLFLVCVNIILEQSREI